MVKLNNLNKEAVLVYVNFSKSEDIDWNIKECLDLACSAEIKVSKVFISNCKVINPKYYIGSGKVLEIKDILKHNQTISFILFNCVLSSNQERNLVCLFERRVIDRNQLIFNIFAKRARTYEGKLQIKLAQLRYLNSRLIREWSHLERQKGGIGMRGGPGEMQLEKDRRLVRKQIFRIVSNLKKIENQRKKNRIRRMKIGMSTISLVGYTNAGKSTLFNVMTSSHVDTSEKLFSTLDPVFRSIVMQKRSNLILIDTVGFIQNLPKDLIIAFQATLEETIQSKLLLHVIDASSKKIEQNISSVNFVLNKVNADNIPVILVMNKIDKIDKIEPHIDRNSDGLPFRVWISATNQLGISLLNQVINELLLNNSIMMRYQLRMSINNDLYEKLLKLQIIEYFHFENKNIVKLGIYISYKDWNRLIKYHKSLLDYII